mmetsp:Transcript_3665/g.12312  ORF Transcript_3665/g.12312 Transcript_3665/m.12312 type:complete len:247 (+) Transcript_3665:884-1624(+)
MSFFIVSMAFWYLCNASRTASRTASIFVKSGSNGRMSSTPRILVALSFSAPCPPDCCSRTLLSLVVSLRKFKATLTFCSTSDSWLTFSFESGGAQLSMTCFAISNQSVLRLKCAVSSRSISESLSPSSLVSSSSSSSSLLSSSSLSCLIASFFCISFNNKDVLLFLLPTPPLPPKYAWLMPPSKSYEFETGASAMVFANSTSFPCSNAARMASSYSFNKQCRNATHLYASFLSMRDSSNVNAYRGS